MDAACMHAYAVDWSPSPVVLGGCVAGSLLCYHHHHTSIHRSISFLPYSTRRTKLAEIKRTEHPSVLPAEFVKFCALLRQQASGNIMLRKDLTEKHALTNSDRAGFESRYIMPAHHEDYYAFL